MATLSPPALVRGITDQEDRIVEGDEALLHLNARCGGSLAGVLAIPELFTLVRQSRLSGLKLAREFCAFDGTDQISGFARIGPIETDGQSGCELVIENWQRSDSPASDEHVLERRLDDIDRMVAEMSARLDPKLRVLTAQTHAPDLAHASKAIAAKPKALWSEVITLANIDYREPLHWRLLDGAKCIVEGSDRDWRMRLFPLGPEPLEPEGFEMLLVSEQPWLTEANARDCSDKAQDLGQLGETLARVLRQPISRVISNAETIRSRLAGPLRQEYADYAGDIASAGSHLLALLDDLADLEVVESDNFRVELDDVGLFDVAERAAGILRVKAQAKGITITLPENQEEVEARGEFRRVLQILINVMGNAINYSPQGSTITVAISKGIQSAISVSDEGPGLSRDQQSRIFTKFERLGRDGDGGSGLGLYISQRLADAMGGKLSVDSQPDEGATFTLSLPKAK
jgi:signal transduction histidine kinase